ncbi:MAG: hypothetical protein ACTSUA_03490 [Candidatus Heimdallarchaeota archaeon]|nr:MAG: hypothetical protein DRO63_08955 [Candidatus Gerdarchaeota archaeon]RLI67151.1 MAG: hypothetical protein DRO91_10610 [Candidatus Heimdallarchaeota archaeon]
MNKKLAIILPIVVIGVVAASIFLVPMIMYGGATVPVVEGTLTFETTSTSPADFSTLLVGPNIGNVNLELHNKTMSAINYGFDGINGRNEAGENNPSGDISLELSIIFIISKNDTILKEIDIGVLHGEGIHNVSILLGPAEGLTTEGTFELTISISLKLHTPLNDLTLDVDLGPFSFYFNPQA